MLSQALTVGKLAARCDVPTKTIRYYEDIGLLPRPPRLASGYRQYDQSYVARLDFIARAKRLGLSLDEIGGILKIRDTGACPCEHVSGLLERHLLEIDETVEELRRFRSELADLRGRAASRKNGAGVCEIIEHAELRTHLPRAFRSVMRRSDLTFQSDGGLTIRRATPKKR